MALTTNMKVWKIMFVIFLILTCFFSLLIYFKDLFIVFFVGLIIILFTDKFGSKDKKKTFWTKLSQVSKFLFWICVFSVIFYYQIQDISALVTTETYQSYNILQYFSQIETYIPSFLGQKIITFENVDVIRAFVFDFFSSIISGLSYFVFNGILIIPLMLYMYYSRNNELKKIVLDAVPKKFHNAVASASKQIYDKSYDFFSAKLIESTIVGLICSFGFFVTGLKAWLVFGVICGLFNIVPYIGPILGSIPALVVAAIHGNYVFIFTFLTIFIAQLVDNIYLIPFMISSKVNIDSLVAILLFLVGAKAMGVFGMVFSIPIYIVFKIVLLESYYALVKVYSVNKIKSFKTKSTIQSIN